MPAGAPWRRSAPRLAGRRGVFVGSRPVPQHHVPGPAHESDVGRRSARPPGGLGQFPTANRPGGGGRGFVTAMSSRGLAPRLRSRTTSPSEPRRRSRRSCPRRCCSCSARRWVAIDTVSPPSPCGRRRGADRGRPAGRALRGRGLVRTDTAAARSPRPCAPAPCVAGVAVIVGVIVGPALPGASSDPLLDTRPRGGLAHDPEPPRRHPGPPRQPERRRALHRREPAAVVLADDRARRVRRAHLAVRGAATATRTASSGAACRTHSARRSSTTSRSARSTPIWLPAAFAPPGVARAGPLRRGVGQPADRRSTLPRA